MGGLLERMRGGMGGRRGGRRRERRKGYEEKKEGKLISQEIINFKIIRKIKSMSSFSSVIVTVLNLPSSVS